MNSDIRYIAAWCVRGWDEETEPVYEQTECASLASAKRTASRMAKQFQSEWGEATVEERDRYGWQETGRFHWDSFSGWREIR